MPTPNLKPEATVIDNRLPTCRNYWRFGSSPSPPQRPPSYLLQPHLIASSASKESEGKNPNSKYYKLRHGHGAGQFSPLNDDMMSYHQYRVRLPFDPSPFRGITRFAFWILFLSILILLGVLITALLRTEDFHIPRPSSAFENEKPSVEDSNSEDGKGELENSYILKNLINSKFT